MLRSAKLNILSFLVIGILITWGKYTIVIGQTTVKPVLVALNKTDNTLAIIEPGEMKVLGKVATGDSPHEVVLSSDGKTAYVANYGAQTPGSSISIIDTLAMKETRRVDVSPLRRPHGLKEIGGKLYFTSETNRIIARYDPAANKIDWMMGTGQNGSHMVVATADEKRFYTANIGSDSITAFEFQAVPPAASKITHIPVGKQPEAIDVSPDGKEVWVGLNAEGGIDIVDTAANKVIERVKLGERPYRVMFTPDGKQVFCTIPNTKEIVVIDAATRKELRRMKLETVPIGITFSKNGKFAFVTAVQPDAALKIDLEKFEVAGRADSGKGPDGIAVAGL
jgi:YVTN family beta-propeller protein